MVGLDVSDRSIKLAEVTSHGGAKLNTVCWSPLAPGAMERGIVQDPDLLADAISGAMNKCSPVPLGHRSLVVSIPERQSFIRVIDLPQMKAGETSEAVRWAVRQHIPFDVDKVYLDWQPISQAGEKATHQRLLVGAAQRVVIDPLLKALDKINANVVALELEAQAIVRSMLPLNDPTVTGVLLIDLGATVTNIVYVTQGTIQFTTSIQRGGDHLTQVLIKQLGLTPDIAAKQKAATGLTQSQGQVDISHVLISETKKLVEEIKQIVSERLVGSPDQEIKAILLAGGASNLRGIIELFSQSFPNAPVQIGNALANVNHGGEKEQALASQDATHFSTAIGLALRQYEQTN